MRFLVDENLSPELADLLRAAGHDVVHVRDLGMKSANDLPILGRARADNRILITADTDFGGLLAHTGAPLPSVIQLRRLQGRRAAELADTVLRHLPDISQDLERGAIVAFDDARIRIRSLPVNPDQDMD